MSVMGRFGVVAPIILRRFIGRVSACDYGSAAAVQFQYDYDYYEDEELEMARKDRVEPKPMLDSDGWVPERGIQWVIIGDRGAKKHVYAQRLSELLEVPYISMGTLVRQELNPRSSLYKQIANAVNEGKLVPKEIIFALLSKRLEERYSRGETGFILDGIPRTRVQAEILDQIADVDLVINFKSTEEHLEKKNLGTGNFSPCGEYLSMRTATADGGASWKEKFNVHKEQGKQLEDYYKKQKKVIDFQVKGPPGETWKGLLAALHLQHINAVSSSQKLAA